MFRHFQSWSAPANCQRKPVEHAPKQRDRRDNVFSANQRFLRLATQYSYLLTAEMFVKEDG